MKRIFIAAAVLLASTTAQIASAQTATPFRDVPTNHWAADAVAKLFEEGIIIGYPADEKPTRTISSAPPKVEKIAKTAKANRARDKKYAAKTR